MFALGIYVAKCFRGPLSLAQIPCLIRLTQYVRYRRKHRHNIVPWAQPLVQ